MTIRINEFTSSPVSFQMRVSDALNQRRNDILTFTSTTMSSTTLSSATFSQSPTSASMQNIQTAFVAIGSDASSTARLHWGILIDNGSCINQPIAETSKSCVAEYVVIGIESAVLAVIILIGIYFYVKSRGGCDLPSISFNFRRKRDAPPMQVTREDTMWENEMGYATHGGTSGGGGGGSGGVDTTNFSPSSSHIVTSPSRSNPLTPQKAQTTNGQQQRAGLMVRQIVVD
uniref:Mid2 domain-containing protein n=1 Tax=Plectus sambesii TaxID=2011161 RepID=A0A914WRG1_9BILA